jgi:hypothetical protein
MPVFETSTGSRLDLMLPHTSWPELQRAVAEYQYLLKERKAAGYRVGALVHEQERAIRKDLDALKQTLLKGGEDPGAKHEAKVKKEAEAAKRRFDALDLALEDAEMKLIDVVDDHRDEWLAEIEETQEKARTEYEEVVETLNRLRARLTRQRSLKNWLTNFPEQPSFRIGFPHLRNLTAPSGDPYAWEHVIDALRKDANPPQAVPNPLGPPNPQPLTRVT